MALGAAITINSVGEVVSLINDLKAAASEGAEEVRVPARRWPQTLLAQKTGKQRLSELTRREASSLLSELAAANGTHS